MPKLPKYVEIENYFKTKIESGELQADQPLPPESEICAEFSTSHMTVSRAMTSWPGMAISSGLKAKGLLRIIASRQKSRKTRCGQKALPI